MTPSVEQALMRLLHGEMPAHEAAALREKMAREPELAAAYERLERSWSSLALPPFRGVPPGFSGRVVARIADLPRPGSLSWGAAPRWVRATAAACLIAGAALGVGVGGRWTAKGSGESATEIFGAVQAEDSESLNESYWGEVADATLDGGSRSGAAGEPDDAGDANPGDVAQGSPL